MRFKKWNIGTPAERDVALLRSAGYPYLLSTVLAARGVTTAEAAAEALERDRSLSMSPMLMRDMDKAVARIQRAISQGETIAVFGDYDVDGITSTVLLMDYLKSCGVRCLRHIPRRIEEGYGLSKEAIQGLRDQGATLMITVDCGITGNEEVDFAASIGLDVVITDHHECKEELPRALAVVDPHRSDCPYPFKHLAGVGVALKLVLALGGESREDALFARYCTLAAIGTIADVMRMEGENRTIAFCGLEALPHTDFVGVHALLKEAGLLGKPITSVQIGFVLAPRINAAGRMGAADLAADLLQRQAVEPGTTGVAAGEHHLIHLQLAIGERELPAPVACRERIERRTAVLDPRCRRQPLAQRHRVDPARQRVGQRRMRQRRPRQRAGAGRVAIAHDGLGQGVVVQEAPLAALLALTGGELQQTAIAPQAALGVEGRQPALHVEQGSQVEAALAVALRRQLDVERCLRVARGAAGDAFTVDQADSATAARQRLGHAGAGDTGADHCHMVDGTRRWRDEPGRGGARISVRTEALIRLPFTA